MGLEMGGKRCSIIIWRAKCGQSVKINLTFAKISLIPIRTFSGFLNSFTTQVMVQLESAKARTGFAVALVTGW